MNPIDDQLNRLFRAASQQASAPDAVPPFGMDTRVMAAWREGRKTPASFWETGVLVRGMIAACAIMAVSFLPVLTSTSSSTSSTFADFLQMTDSTVSSDVTP